jgi:hypothetical protein
MRRLQVRVPLSCQNVVCSTILCRCCARDVLCNAVLCCAVPQECLEAAGEWETLMAVCVCCGDFGALRSMAAGLKVSLSPAGSCFQLYQFQL